MAARHAPLPPSSQGMLDEIYTLKNRSSELQFHILSMQEQKARIDHEIEALLQDWRRLLARSPGQW